MQSPIFQEWVKEERTEAEARGEARGKAIGEAKGKAIGEARGEARGIKTAQDSICKYLAVRFGSPAHQLQQQVRNISSLTELNRIIDSIYTVDTLEEAQAVVLGAN